MFTTQLNELFERTTPAPSNATVVRALTENGCPISTPYLSQLRRGIRTHPADTYVRALAEYFEVPTTYFYEPHGNVDSRDPELIDHILDDAVRRLLLNTQGLSAPSTDILTQFVEHLRPPTTRPT